ncbi:MAG: porin family protein [Rhodospirillales bacterium]|nr:MAG: porin family protein [Rhodospirillales bacterium]
MRKSLSALTVLSLISYATTAGAEAWYAGGYGAINYTHDGSTNDAGVDASYDFGLGLGGYFGFHVQENIRLEGELSYRTNDIDSRGGVPIAGKVESLALMANAFVDFKLKSNVEPYIGAGIGAADVDYRISGIDYTDTVLALQVMGGFATGIAPTVDLTVDYRLFLTDEVRVGSGVGWGRVDYVNSAVTVGIRKTF